MLLWFDRWSYSWVWGTVGLSLLLPFVFGMEPISGIAMMMGLLSVVATSDTFPAVLIGVPGSVSAQATVMDGFPLAKKGQAARALSAAFSLLYLVVCLEQLY